MNEYNCKELDINHSQFVQLRDNRECNLGVVPDVARAIVQNSELKPPTGSATRSAFIFWNLIGFLVLGYSVYLVFNKSWIAFTIMFLISGVIFSTNKKSNAQNLLEDAYTHKVFYEKIRSLDGWQYQMSDRVAEQFKRQ